jgi:hypothetical protein
MPKTLTETSNFDATISIPQDGDDANATTGGTDRPIEDSLQKLTNRSKYLFDQIPSGIAWGGSLSRVYSDGTSVKVPPLLVILVGKVLFTVAETTVALSGLTGGTWYYLYCYNSGGSLAFELSTTAPEVSLQYKTGGLTHRYLAAVRALSATTCRPFRKVGTRHNYRLSASAFDAFKVLDAGGATAFTDVSLAGHVPPHARLAHVAARLVYVSGAGSMQLRTKGDTAGENYYLDTPNTVGASQRRDVCVETDSAQAIQYLVSTSGVNAYLWATGFEDG